MTPKEKANELVHQYVINMPIPFHIEDAKICALIAVDEIIEYHNSLFDKGFKDVHIALSSPIKTYIDILNPLLNYWQEVKQEIEEIEKI